MGFGEEQGVIPRFCDELFSRLASMKNDQVKWSIFCNVVIPPKKCPFSFTVWCILLIFRLLFFLICEGQVSRGDELLWGVQWKNSWPARGPRWAKSKEDARKCFLWSSLAFAFNVCWWSQHSNVFPHAATNPFEVDMTDQSILKMSSF